MTDPHPNVEEQEPRSAKREWVSPELEVEPLNAALSVYGGPTGLDGTGYS